MAAWITSKPERSSRVNLVGGRPCASRIDPRSRELHSLSPDGARTNVRGSSKYPSPYRVDRNPIQRSMPWPS